MSRPDTTRPTRSSDPSDPYANTNSHRESSTTPESAYHHHHHHDPTARDTNDQHDDDDDDNDNDDQNTQSSTPNYYAVLNLSKQATEEDIKNSYRRLGLLYHPDKHQTPQDKAIASESFQSIQRAYDVLSDPTRRYLYDTYGEKALHQSWDLGPRLKTPEQIRAEYERRLMRDREMDLENLVKSRGEISVTLNATQLFDPLLTTKLPLQHPPNPFAIIPNIPKQKPEHLLDYLVWPEVTQAVVKHSWQTTILPGSTFNIHGAAVARNGIGTGNVLGTIKHSFSSRLLGELTGGFAESPMAQLKMTYNITAENFVTFAATSTSLSSPPPLLLVLGRRFTPNTTAYVTYRTGEYILGSWGLYAPRRGEPAAFSLGLVRRTLKTQVMADFTLATSSVQASVAASRALTKNIRARASVGTSTNLGLTYSLGLDQKLTKHSTTGMTLDCASVGGVKLILRYTRVGQKFSLPIIISPHLDIRVSIMAGCIPLFLGIIFDLGIMSSIKKKSRQDKLAKIRSENVELLAQRKKEAEDAVRLMSKSVGAKRQAEQNKNGLVIVEALYGKLDPLTKSQPSTFLCRNNVSVNGNLTQNGHSNGTIDGDTRKEPDGNRHHECPSGISSSAKEYIDVTIPVQSLVLNSQLHIDGGFSKSSLLGFYDPCLGENKKLRVAYEFHGGFHVVEVDDMSSLAAPLRAHLVKSQ
ncbi:hypothetical protein SeMB42_g02493 [Synchytrium endobioticum]|uniref:J domain-containing protein n=1 Tax=Synchytrium endobioticum TaxID=286115 RepID=A0A507DE22_9FUNG|nr:hypothetical protein SeLEV6574_g03597 [Synchytrium endobioticum]TPX49776.1 hypothetical protein SeMB42_g02493 [Synchytrium endobioticum]